MKRKIYKILKRFLLSLFLGILLVYASMRFWLSYRFDEVVKNINYEDYVEELKKSKPLPDRVFAAFSRVHLYNQHTSTDELILKTPLRIFNSEIKPADCPCVEVNYGLVFSFWDRLTVGLQLDQDVGPKKCLEYYINNFHFGYEKIGLREASLHYYQKSLEDLSEKELHTLCHMMKNPAYFNPFKSQDKEKENANRPEVK